TACAALTLQVESGGRAVLAIGRGDSSVQRIGKTQDPVAHFEGYVAQVQAYLRGEAVDRDGFPSRIEWLPRGGGEVPVWVGVRGRGRRESARPGWRLPPAGSSRRPHARPIASASRSGPIPTTSPPCWR